MGNSTRGPWKWRLANRASRIVIYSPETDFPVASIIPTTDEPHAVCADDPNQLLTNRILADADLIAAAPALVGALGLVLGCPHDATAELCSCRRAAVDALHAAGVEKW